MNDLVEELDTKCNTRSGYGVELDEDGNVKSLNKKLNYCPQKSNTSSFRLESFRRLGTKKTSKSVDPFKSNCYLL